MIHDSNKLHTVCKKSKGSTKDERSIQYYFLKSIVLTRRNKMRIALDKLYVTRSCSPVCSVLHL
jgi:hypothetical protein